MAWGENAEADLKGWKTSPEIVPTKSLLGFRWCRVDVWMNGLKTN